MEIIDLTKKQHNAYFHCLEEWSEDMKDAGKHKQVWFDKMKDKGLRVKIAFEADKTFGMIQYVPIEYSIIEGEDLYFIKCIWVHGHKQGIGNFQKMGIGKALLWEAENDIRSMKRKGVAAWGLSLPFWMKASWFKKQGYKAADKNGMAKLMWKPFTDDAIAPRWIKQKKRPITDSDKVIVTSFVNGWCPAMNIAHERAKRAAQEIGSKVEYQEINTFDRDVLYEWGISDALFINGKEMHLGPPPSYEKIKKKIAKRAKSMTPGSMQQISN